ncbi:uncharacterized protein K452DRAFT_254914 [Aplosporella prunicola CBS 121167]|uniref:NAD(P)-binding protein n=1 Tax=Aplosporella prunicola CBS 121167 TaxID=1176127 RepID=A0A6A6B6N6_9PEZI|nr:uncharacterized protein K452DRAFT_254914 [Aplosporella prunicola CBS 121167]KAF2138915.1 hypothetical protein K452DRAFT_254914 [Aplosporella prunicola CBS 121167]
MDPDMFTKPFQLTKAMRRDLYPAVDPHNPNLSAKGKVVIVTGAGGGIGSSVAKAWAQADAEAILLVGRTASKLEVVAKEVGPRSVVNVTDMTSEKDVESLFKTVQAKYGRLDALINAAGSGHPGLTIAEIEPSDWWQDYEATMKATFLATHFYAKFFNGSGTIINVVSIAALIPKPKISSYSSAKLSQIKFGELVGLEFPDLRVFSVHPGIVEPENGRGIDIPGIEPFAKDKAILTGGLSLFLATAKVDRLAGMFLSVNWDIDEVMEHLDEIVEKGLLKPVGIRAQLGPGGHPWSK